MRGDGFVKFLLKVRFKPYYNFVSLELAGTIVKEKTTYWVNYAGPLRDSVLVATASVFLAVAFSRRWTNPRRIGRQIRRGYQSCFFVATTSSLSNLFSVRMPLHD